MLKSWARIISVFRPLLRHVSGTDQPDHALAYALIPVITVIGLVGGHALRGETRFLTEKRSLSLAGHSGKW